MELSEWREELAGVLCPQSHRQGWGSSITHADGTTEHKGGTYGPCIRHRAEADVLMPLIERLCAEAWDEGYRSGLSNAMRRMSDEPNAPTTRNPYRTTAYPTDDHAGEAK